MSAEVMHSTPPPGVESLLPISPEEELYRTFTARVSDFGGFRQRPFQEARDDFIAPVHEAAQGDDLWPIELRRAMIQIIITPESYEAFRDEVQAYWQTHDLEEKLQTHSVVFLTNHRAFSDIPVTAVAVSDFRQDDPYAVQRNVQVVGRMIPGMEVDTEGTGDYNPVTPLLARAGRQVQTVPGAARSLSDEAKAQRKIWNSTAKHVIGELLQTPGNILYIAASGTHDKHEDDKLIMQHVNRETVKLLARPNVIVVPLFFSCTSFSAEGFEPALATYALLPPRTIDGITDGIEDVRQIMTDLATVGSEKLADEFSGGVHYAENILEKGTRFGTNVAKRIGNRVTRRAQED